MLVIENALIVHSVTNHLDCPRGVLIQPQGVSPGSIWHLERSDVIWLLPGSPALHHHSLDTGWGDKVDLRVQPEQLELPCV